MSKRNVASLVGLIACGALAGGCASSGSSESNGNAVATTQASGNRHEQTFAALPAGHLFTQLRYGMGGAEVVDTIGEPTDRGGYVTGQAWNPFYYGTDTSRETWYYKGQGRLTFNSRGRLIEAHANADERGYR